MTKKKSCETCEYFDSKDWDSETKNWCRYNDQPAINEGLCGHHEPRIKPCPFCGARAEMRFGHNHCYARCTNQECLARTRRYRYATDAIIAWNKRARDPIEELRQNSLLPLTYEQMERYYYGNVSPFDIGTEEKE